MTKVLILGAGGMLGGKLAARLADQLGFVADGSFDEIIAAYRHEAEATA